MANSDSSFAVTGSSSSGMSLIELIIAIGILSVAIAAIAGMLIEFNKSENQLAAADHALTESAVALETLRKDFSIAETREVNDGKLTLNGQLFQNGSLIPYKISYSTATQPCPEFGQAAECVTLIRTLTTNPGTLSAVESAPAMMGRFERLEWCLQDTNPATGGIGDCSILPTAPALPLPASSSQRLVVQFQRYLSLGNEATAAPSLFVAAASNLIWDGTVRQGVTVLRGRQ